MARETGYVTSHWQCTKCGHEYLAPKKTDGSPVHGCPKCNPEKLKTYVDQLTEIRKTQRNLNKS